MGCVDRMRRKKIMGGNQRKGRSEGDGTNPTRIGHPPSRLAGTVLGDGCLLLDMGCGTDHLPEIGPAGLPFFGPAPPIHEERETETANDLRAEKK